MLPRIGNIDHHDKLGKFGENPSVGSSEEDIWDAGEAYSYLTSAERLKISSDDANDTEEGTGLRTVQIYGLSETYAEINEIVILNGLTGVETDNSFIRIFRMIGRSAGSDGKNVGNILAKNNVESITLAQIQEGHGQTLMALWTVPRGKKLYLVQWYGACSASGGRDTQFHLYIRPFGEIFQLKRHIDVNAFFNLLFPLTHVVEAKSDIAARAHCTIPGSMVSSGFDGWYR